MYLLEREEDADEEDKEDKEEEEENAVFARVVLAVANIAAKRKGETTRVSEGHRVGTKNIKREILAIWGIGMHNLYKNVRMEENFFPIV